MQHDPRPRHRPLSSERLQAMQHKPALFNDASYEPQITRSPLATTRSLSVDAGSALPPKLGRIPKSKFSSTSTIFMNNDNNVLAPAVHDVLRCIAITLHYNMEQNTEDTICDDIWSERVHPQGDGKSDFVNIPSTEEVLFFLQTLWDGQSLSAESAVMCLAYIDRFTTITNTPLRPHNWRRITLAAAVLASKVWEDLAVWNADFLTFFPGLQISDLNLLEKELLTSLDFVVGLKASLYAKYYFDLRTLSEKNEINFPLRPLLTSEGKMESLSLRFEDKVRSERFRMPPKSRSIDPRVFSPGIKR